MRPSLCESSRRPPLGPSASFFNNAQATGSAAQANHSQLLVKREVDDEKQPYPRLTQRISSAPTLGRPISAAQAADHRQIRSDRDIFRHTWGMRLSFHVLCPSSTPMHEKMAILINGFGGEIIDVRRAMYIVVDCQPGFVPVRNTDDALALAETKHSESRSVVSYAWIEACTFKGCLLDHRPYAVHFAPSEAVTQASRGHRDAGQAVYVVEDDSDEDMVISGDEGRADAREGPAIPPRRRKTRIIYDEVKPEDRANYEWLREQLRSMPADQSRNRAFLEWDEIRPEKYKWKTLFEKYKNLFAKDLPELKIYKRALYVQS